MRTTSTLRLVVCASLVAVVLGQQPLPGLQNFGTRRQQNLIPQRQLVNQGFGNQPNQGFGNQGNQGFRNQGNQGFGEPVNQGFREAGSQGFGGQQDIVTSAPVRQPIRPQVPIRRQPVIVNPQPQVIINQQRSEILEDIRDGPFWDGSYYFRYQTSDGTIREEGGRPLPDGSMLVTGQYGYRAPNGEVFETEYIADRNGYQAFRKGTRADFIPPQRAAPPQGLPPFNQFIDGNNFNDGNNFITAQPQPQPRPQQPRPQARPVAPRPRPINTQNLNQLQPVNNNNLVRPGNNINAVNLNGIRPTPGNFQGQFQGFGANLSGQQFGQVNRDGQGQDINFSGGSSDDTFNSVDNENAQNGLNLNSF